MDINKLPSLTPKENAFLFHFFTDCLNDRSKAYKASYNCKGSTEKTIYEEASKLLKNPKLTPWIEYYKASLQEYQENEIKYTRSDFFNDLDRIRAKTEDTKNVGVALKAIELKGKAAGHLKDKVELSGGTVVQMGNVQVQGKELTFDVGTAADDSTRDT